MACDGCCCNNLLPRYEQIYPKMTLEQLCARLQCFYQLMRKTERHVEMVHEIEDIKRVKDEFVEYIEDIDMLETEFENMFSEIIYLRSNMH